MGCSLTLEIYKEIAQHVNAQTTDCGRYLSAPKRIAQANLLNLALASKTLYKIVMPMLHHDCFIARSADLERYFSTPWPWDQFQTTERLTTTHDFIPDNAIYIYLLGPDPANYTLLDPDDTHIDEEKKLVRPKTSSAFAWRYLKVLRSPAPSVETDGEGMLKETFAMGAVGTHLLRYLDANANVFPNLRQAVMGSNYPAAITEYTCQNHFKGWHMFKTADSIPLAMLDNPVVEHYCQSDPAGPLALPNAVIKIDNPPRVVNYHLSAYSMNRFDNFVPGVVLGATNRYFCGMTKLLPLPVNDLLPMGPDILDQLVPFINLLLRSDYTFIPQDPDYDPSDHPVDVDALAGTVIELYGYVRVAEIHDEELSSDDFLEKMMDPLTFVNRPPGSLANIQVGLDDMIGAWKGHDVLKNLEDAPSCSACGLDYRAQYKRTPINGELYVPA